MRTRIALVVLLAIAVAAQVLVRRSASRREDEEHRPAATEETASAETDVPRERPTRFDNDAADAEERARCERLVGEALRTDDPLRRQEAIAELASIGGADGVRALDRIARIAPDTLGQHVATRLGRIESRAAAPILRSIIEREGRRGPLAAAAMRALGRSRLRSDVALARDIAMDGGLDREMRAAAIEALGRIADQVALPVLARLARSDDALLRRRALRAIGRMPSRRSEELLEGVIASPPGDLEASIAKEMLDELRGQPRPRR